MMRRLFTSASVLSLLLFAATFTLWARSYSRLDIVTYHDDSAWYNAATANGQFSIRRFIVDEDMRGVPQGWQQHTSSLLAARNLQSIGNRMMIAKSGRGPVLGFWWGRVGAMNAIIGPILTIACAAIILPAVWIVLRLRNYRRWMRRLDGECEHCGYDLRASKDRCPECGTSFHAP